jgi:cytochrome P450
MAKPERRDPAKEAFWRRMLVRFGRSNSTVGDFCFEHGIGEANFYAWRREIARRDREAPRAAAAMARARPAAVATSSVFVNVRAADTGLVDPGIPKTDSATTSAAAAGTALEVILSKPGTSGRRRLLVRPGFDADSLRRLLPLLEAEAEERSAGSAPSEKPSC